MSPFAAAMKRQFLPDGKVIARHTVKLGREYAPGEELPAAELTPRLVEVLWRQYAVDTVPRESVTLPAPAASQLAKSHQQRR